MPDSTSEGLNAAFQSIGISHAIGLRRLSTATANKIRALLDEVDTDLIDRIKTLDPSSVAARYTRQRLDKLLKDIRGLNKGVYGQVGAALRTDLVDLAEYEAQYQAKTIAPAIGIGFGEFNLPTRQMLTQLVTDEPIEGRYLKEWVDGLEAGRYDRLRSAIRMSVVEGEGVGDLVRRVEGTPDLNYKDGILQISRRSAETFARTAINHSATQARQAMFEENKDLLDGWRFVATLDAATCEECAAYDGEIYAIGEGVYPPIHPNCRCTTVPVVKGGGAADRITYNAWLKSQPEEVQNEALGPTRAELFREGDLSIKSFVDDLGRPLTLEQLRLIEPDAFMAATPDAGIAFVSPNVHNLDFDSAVGALDSERQSALRDAAHEIDDQLGIDSRSTDVIGAWSDGAENSVMIQATDLGSGTPDQQWERFKDSTVIKGYLADQKQVLAFQRQEDGPSSMYQFTATGDLKDIHQNLLDDGVQFHTLVPTEDGAKVFVVDLDGSALDAVDKGAERYDAEVKYWPGRAEFLGSEAEGTDREQRDAARAAYEEAIGQSPIRESQGVLESARDNWGEALGVEDLTDLPLKTDADFIRWFGDSQVVDESGDPLKVYHGSGRKGIDVFDPALTGSVETSDWGKGVYFTPSESTADFYREAAVKATDAEDARLWAAYEAEANRLGTSPMMAGIDLGRDSPEYQALDEFQKAWRAHREELGQDKSLGQVYEAFLKVDNPLIYKYEGVTDPYLAEQALSTGHDGIFVIGEYPAEGQHISDKIEEIVVFSPDQIKSAEVVEQLADLPIGEGLNPDVVNVGGDVWNRETAERLEQEYLAAKPTLEKLAIDIEGTPADVLVSNPQSWDDLTGSGQTDAETAWKDHNLDGYIESEKDNWFENGDAQSDAAREIEYGIEKDGFGSLLEESGDDNPLVKVRDAWQEDNGEDIPFTDEQITNALKIEVNENTQPLEFGVDIDDSKLGIPEGFDEGPMLRPGISDTQALIEAQRFSASIGEDWGRVPPADQKRYIEGARETLRDLLGGDTGPFVPENPADRLTPEMRDEIKSEVKTYLDKLAETKASDMEPPEYLEESAKESLDMVWDEMDDDSKFGAAKDYIDVTGEDGDNYAVKGVVTIPDKFDPLEKTHGQDYNDTQSFMQSASVERSAQIMVERNALGVESSTIEVAREQAAELDRRLWNEWKGSSQSEGGVVLQGAVAEELGGRTSKHISDDWKRLSEQYGGPDAVKAYVRGKWEVTQYALDKSGDDTVQVYRSLKHLDPPTDVDTAGHWPTEIPRLDLTVDRNGIASTTLDPAVANSWGGPQRTVLRIEVPRTAIMSVPAYGGNYHEEHEVVVAGTAWKGWDAWYGTAPTFERTPIASTLQSEQLARAVETAADLPLAGVAPVKDIGQVMTTGGMTVDEAMKSATGKTLDEVLTEQHEAGVAIAADRGLPPIGFIDASAFNAYPTDMASLDAMPETVKQRIDHMQKAVAAIPEEHQKIFEDQGLTLRVVPTLEVSDGGQAYGIYEPHPGGAGMPPVIQVALKAGGHNLVDPIGTTVHELGHALSYAQKGAVTNYVGMAVQEDALKGMSKAGLYAADHYLSSPKEMFAELYRLEYSPSGYGAFGLPEEKAKIVFSKSLEIMRTVSARGVDFGP